MTILPSAPIAQFDPYNDPKDGDQFAIVEQATGQTKRINVKYFFAAQPSTNYKWVSTFDYPVDAIVEHAGAWYRSLQTPNLGQNPATQPLFWEEIPKSASGFVFWAAGVFTGAEVFVLRILDQFVQIFRLVSATRPYLSSNFESEYASGDWELMSERGYIGIPKAGHGFILNDVLTYKAGAWNKFTAGDTALAIVRNVVSADLVIVVLLGHRLKGLAGLTPGSTYYAQSDATITTTVSSSPIFLAVSATEAILLASGGGGTDHFKGAFANEAALDAAFPTASPGDYALVDVGASEAQLFIWDDTDTDWVASGVTTVVPAWDDATAGIVERSSQAEAELVSDQVEAGAVGALSGLRAPSEIGLFHLLVRFLTRALTWAAKQTFTTAPRFSSTTASQFLKVDGSKDLVSVASATQAEMITGTDDTKPATAKSVEDKRSVKSVSVSNGATGTTNIDCGLKQEVKAIFNTPITGAAEITVSNATNLEVLHITIPITGSNIAITFPSTTRMSRQNEVASGDGWYQSTKVLQVSSIGTADTHEFDLVRASSGPTFKLLYDGAARA